MINISSLLENQVDPIKANKEISSHKIMIRVEHKSKVSPMFQVKTISKLLRMIKKDLHLKIRLQEILKLKE